MQQDASKAQALKEKVIVIDCRNQNEWDRGHVNVGNVLHIPLPQLENSPKLAKIQKDTPIMIHCAVGGRSAKGNNVSNATTPPANNSKTAHYRRDNDDLFAVTVFHMSSNMILCI